MHACHQPIAALIENNNLSIRFPISFNECSISKMITDFDFKGEAIASHSHIFEILDFMRDEKSFFLWARKVNLEACLLIGDGGIEIVPKIILIRKRREENCLENSAI